MMRVLIVAMVATLPYYELTGRLWNPVFSLLLGLIIVDQIHMHERWWVAAGIALPVIAGGDWYMCAVPVAAAFGYPKHQHTNLVLLTVINAIGQPWNALGLLGCLIIAKPVGVQWRPHRWLKLGYYPAHLAVIAAWMQYVR